MNIKKPLSLLVTALAASTVLAAAPAAPAPDSIPFVVQQVEANTGYKVIKKIDAKGGLTGWIMSQGPGKNITAFTPKDNSVVLLGNMLDANGKNWSKEYAEQHGVQIDFKKAWADLEKTVYVKQSVTTEPKAVIYVFKDANCGYCHLAYLALQPYVEAGLEVRWVPVAFLAPDSADRAAYLVSATDKNKALKEISDNFGRREAPAVYAKVTPEMKVAFSKNSDLMRSLGFSGTPGVVYKDKNGEIKGLGGMFKLSQIPDLTGMPLIPNKDPALKKFE